ncbi:MAG: SdrD B-like domain-containing protein [Cyanobacteriota bacterium]|jgi:protocatechuate 3,4-dioxygenase beta subunit
MTYQPPAYQYEISILVLRGDTNFAPRIINSYQDVDVLTAPTELSYLTVPIYDVYCIDRTISIARSTYQDYFVFSSTEFQNSLVNTPLRYQATDNFDGITRVYNYENLDNINWLLNQNFYGTSPSDENGNPISTTSINATDIQNAIWTLLNQQNSSYTPNSNVIWLVNEAVQKGNNYLAAAGQLQGLIIAHEFNQFQPLVLVTQSAQLGDSVWLDGNGNGIQDNGETGIAGVTVKLLRDLNNDGAIATTEVVATTTTGINGFYDFKGLTAGFEYQVLFDPSTASLPVGAFYQLTQANQGATDALDSDAVLTNGFALSQVVTLAPGEYNQTIDAGFIQIDPAPQTASLGNFVWNDANANGIQEDGELGIGNVTVNLLANGEIVATVSTDENGFYIFEDIEIGTYQVQFFQPEGFIASPTGQGDSATDSEGLISAAVTLEGGDYNDTLDAGFYQTASLGNFVWHDLNANGIQDNGEAGISGTAVNLLQNDGIIATVTTDANGSYQFTGLTPGTGYQVQFVQPNGFNGVSPTGQGTGSTDSEGLLSAAITLAPGENNTTLDAGFYQTASLGDRVWLDADRDGIQDNGETGISGAAVHLLQNDGIIATVTTDANGFYQFTGLTPGAAYQVSFDVSQTANGRSLALTGGNQGANDLLDSDAVLTNGAALSQNVTLQSGESNVSLDAGFYNSGAGLTAPGTGTPGFWHQKGLPFWDGIVGNEGKDAGKPGFAKGELLTTSTGILVGDFNRNGVTDNGEDTLFISLANARNLVSGGGGSQVDQKLGRSTVASWLNYLSGNSVDLVGSGKDIADYFGDAVQWLGASQSGVNPLPDSLGNTIHTILDAYNNGSAEYATGNFKR